MHTATWVQILNLVVCISHYANMIGKGMNPIMSKLGGGRLGSLILVLLTDPREGKL